jgi:hypothetical protein
LREGPQRSAQRATAPTGTACSIRLDAPCPVIGFAWVSGGIVFAVAFWQKTDDVVPQRLWLGETCLDARAYAATRTSMAGAWIHHGWHQRRKEHSHGEHD